jgi:thioredoxin 1
MVTTITKENIASLMEESAKKPMIIDVFALWCGPCMSMKPSYDQLAQELGETYTFAELNVDHARDVAISFNVTSVPTFIFIKNKTVVGREVGYMPKDDLKNLIKRYFE